MPSRVGVVAIVLAILSGAAGVALSRPSTPRERAAASTGTVAAPTREQLLAGSAKEFGINPIGSVWGVVMDMGFPDGWASVAALADGTGSLFLSSGGGVVGGGVHKEKKAAKEVCRLADALHIPGPSVTEFPLAAPGRVRFYILTTHGVRTAEESGETLDAGASKLSPLFKAGDEVITLLRPPPETHDGR